MNNIGGSKHYDNFASPTSKAVVLAACGHLVSAVVNNSSGSDVFFQAFDRATVPTNGTVPTKVLPVSAGNINSLDFITGWRFDTGLAYGISTTELTFTDSAATAVAVSVEYI